MIVKTAIMLSKSAATYDNKSAGSEISFNWKWRKSVELLQSLYATLETSLKHQLTFPTENTEISRFFKSVFAIWTYFFNPLSAHSRKFPLVPEGSTWYNLFACRYIMASVWYIPLGGFLRSRLLYCRFSCYCFYIALIPQVLSLVHFHELFQNIAFDKYLSPDF